MATPKGPVALTEKQFKAMKLLKDDLSKNEYLTTKQAVLTIAQSCGRLEEPESYDLTVLKALIKSGVLIKNSDGKIKMGEKEYVEQQAGRSTYMRGNKSMLM